MAVFDVGPAATRIAHQLRRATRILVPHVDDARAFQGNLRAHGLTAGDHRGADLAPSDRFGEIGHQVLRHVAAVVGVDLSRRANAQSTGDTGRRIGRRAQPGGKAMGRIGEQPQHRERIDRRSQLLAASVGQCATRRFGGQVERAVGRLPTGHVGRQVRFANLSAAHEYGSATIDHPQAPLHNETADT